METRARTLIIVEDDNALRDALAFSFASEGFDVRTFADAESLLELGGDLPSCACFVIDFRLPGMDGLELIRRLREGSRRLPAVLITTSTKSVRSKAAIFNVPVLEKPLLDCGLVNTVNDLIRAAPI